MLTLNDNNIFVGQIKELLKNFNLPNCEVNPRTFFPNSFYISGDFLYHLNEKKQIDKKTYYVYNSKINNVTTNLRLDNNLYDKYTHRYLGNYLRFLRDYNGIDLMSMYNCCDYTTLTNSGIKVEQSSLNSTDTKVIRFDTNKNYSCYEFPIKNYVYSLFIQNRFPVEYTLDLTHADISAVEKKLIWNTFYKKITVNKQQCININKLINNASNEIKEIIKAHIFDLRMIIKVSSSYNGYITVLEGDYKEKILNQPYITEQNNKQINITKKTQNNFLYVNEKTKQLCNTGFTLNPQLISYTNTSKALLADKLIQYLTNNVICQLSESYDIKKLQKYLAMLNIEKSPMTGVWQTDTLVALQTFIADNLDNPQCGRFLKGFDLLGYFDSNVEHTLEAYSDKGALI